MRNNSEKSNLQQFLGRITPILDATVSKFPQGSDKDFESLSFPGEENFLAAQGSAEEQGLSQDTSDLGTDIPLPL